MNYLLFNIIPVCLKKAYEFAWADTIMKGPLDICSMQQLDNISSVRMTFEVLTGYGTKTLVAKNCRDACAKTQSR